MSSKSGIIIFNLFKRAGLPHNLIRQCRAGKRRPETGVLVCQGLGSALGSGAHLRGQGGDQFGCFNRRTSFRLQHFPCENRNTIIREDNSLLSPLRQIGDLGCHIFQWNRGVVVVRHPIHQFIRHEWKTFLHLLVQPMKSPQTAEKRLVFTVKFTIIDDIGIISHHITGERSSQTCNISTQLGCRSEISCRGCS